MSCFRAAVAARGEPVTKEALLLDVSTIISNSKDVAVGNGIIFTIAGFFLVVSLLLVSLVKSN